MDLAPRQKYYDIGENTFSNVASQTLGRAGLGPGGSVPGSQSPMPLVQWGETDFKFLVRTADDMGHYFIAPNPEDADVVDLRNEYDDGPTLQWRTEGQLVSFRIRGSLSAPKMDGAHYNPLEGLSKVYENVEGGPSYLDGAGDMVAKVQEQSKAKLKPGYVPDRRGMLDLQDYDVLLQKEVNRGLQNSIVGTGVSLNPAVVPGKKVTVQGAPNIEGAYGVTKVVHSWTPSGGYTNQFTCSASSEYGNPTRPKSNPWYGVVVGRVADNNDPEKLGRLKVQYVWQEQGPTLWARMMTPHAGHDRGFLFIPEIGDEVVVAFEDGDPERPIVLGCLWNKPDTPPTEDYWGNGAEYTSDDVKRIVTKSGHRIQLVDKEGKESITIATPTHLKISMLENSDENGRPTMLLHSDGDIVLHAPQGRIHSLSQFYSREVGGGGSGAGMASGGQGLGGGLQTGSGSPGSAGPSPGGSPGSGEGGGIFSGGSSSGSGAAPAGAAGPKK